MEGNEEFHNCIFSTKCFTKPRRMRMASQAAQCTAQHIPTTSSIGKSEGKRPSRNPKLIWEGNITMILEESGRVKSGFKQYRLQPSARSFVGRRASSAAAELPFFFQEDYFFRMCLLRPCCVTATNCNTASFEAKIRGITTISVRGITTDISLYMAISHLLPNFCQVCSQK